MINANEAASKAKAAVESMNGELKAALSKVIEAAIAQGSCKATFYPRSGFQLQHAVCLLTNLGYKAEVCQARDQRDDNSVKISWGE